MYCVYFTTYSGQLMPPFYIGSGLISKILTQNYHGSVVSKDYKEIWEGELKANPYLFHTEIVSFHEDRQEAYNAEEIYQRQEDVVKSNMYINECFANCGFNFKDREHSKETRNRISKSKIGRPCLEETKDKIRQKKKGCIVSNETRAKMSDVKCKPIICIELNRTFKSCKEAADFMNLKNRGSDIANVAKGRTKSAGGYTWKFIEND